MSAYVVTVVTNQAELTVCELYASYSLASSRALTLARACASTNPLWVNPNAPEEKLEDGSVRWTFLETSRFLVTVHFKHVKDYLPTSNQLEDLRNNSNFIKYGDQLKSASAVSVTDGYQTPRVIALGPIPTPVPPTAPPPVDNFYDLTLPAGFNIHGKPITMQDVYDDPFGVAYYASLSENQQWAIVTARVKKRPSFTATTSSGVLSQSASLDELQKKSPLGLEIRNREISALASFLSEQTDEESSSSSEENY